VRKRPDRSLTYVRRALVRIGISLLCAGVFYTVWLAVFLRAAKFDNSVVVDILWLLAPVVTAAGFAVGILILEHLTTTSRTNFFRIFVWPLTGCAIGAGVVYWFGPMLIVFGMFAAGTVSIALREVFKSSANRGT